MKTVIKAILVLLLSILAGYLLLVFSWYLLPGERYQSHIDEALTVLENEGPYPEEEISQRLLDNFTDATMISEAIDTSEKNPFVRVAASPYVSVVDGDPFTSLLIAYYDTENHYESQSYARYWHGYLLFLKPLLLIFPYLRLRQINGFLQAALLTAVALLLQRRGKKNFLIPFALMVLFMGPTAIAKSLQFSSVHYVMLLMMLLLLLFPAVTADRQRLCLLFLFSGIVTAYLDFLTAPSVTLTVPLTYVCMEMTGRREKDTLRQLLLCSFFWCAGYAGMWAGKWVIAALVQKGAFLDTLLDSIRLRSSTELTHTSISRMAALRRCVKMTVPDPYLDSLAVSYAVLVLAGGMVRRKRILPVGGTFTRLLPYLVPLLIPVLWTVALANHSYEHAHFLTFRTLCPMILCALVMIGELADGTSAG